MGISFERANAWSNFITGKTLEESLQLSEELKNLQESDELVATTIKYAQ
jgi:NifU-like protein involved in Fe-S cluster formation